MSSMCGCIHEAAGLTWWEWSRWKTQGMATSIYSTRVCWLQSPKPQHSAPQCAIWWGQAGQYSAGSSIDKQKFSSLELFFCHVTFDLFLASWAQWKLAMEKKSRPTKRLLRVKTSATMDHCQLSLDTAKRPPVSTAPGPGPANLRVTERRPTLLYMTSERPVTDLPGNIWVRNYLIFNNIHKCFTIVLLQPSKSYLKWN